MRLSKLTLLLILATVLVLAGQVTADHEDATDEDEGVFHGWGAGPMFVVSIFVYWALAIPIALLVYTDATERKMNGTRWFWLIMVPFVGVISVLAYVQARRTHPRVDVFDPWAEGDRAMELRKARGENG